MQALGSIAKTLRRRSLVVESSGVGKAVPQVPTRSKRGTRIHEEYPRGQVYAAQPYAAAWNGGRVRVPVAASWVGPFVRTHVDFTGVNDAIDDDVDAGAHAWNYAQRTISQPTKTPPVLRPMKSRFATARNLNEMSFRETLITLGNRAATSARNAGATLCAPFVLGNEPAPNFAPDVMSPWPNTDRFPIILGSQLTFQYIGATKRQARFGYRLQWVDLPDELIERDLSAIGNLTGRILATAGRSNSGRQRGDAFSVDRPWRSGTRSSRSDPTTAGLSASLPTMSEDERILADQIAAHVQQQIDGCAQASNVGAAALGDRRRHGERIALDTHARRMALARAASIHTRRIAYPDQDNWHPQYLGSRARCAIRTGLERLFDARAFGFDVCDYPNKFLVHNPCVCTHTRRTTG